MKKIIILMCFLCLIFGTISPAVSEESGRGVSLGVSVGAYSIVMYFNSYRFCGELGYQFTERIGIMGEFGYASTTQSYESRSNSYSSSSKMTYSGVPISVTLLFITPVTKRFSPYVGLGVGHYSMTIKEEWTFQSPYYGTDSETETDKIKGFAPHFTVGIESEVLNRVIIFGEVKQIVGKTKLEKTDEYGYSKEDIHFGGPEVKIGIRFYFKD
ncbi:MAG: porin family protein [Candidatus Aminicenantes bacterium]|nr:porin family protein [Candidatus Aminicenantes bacterium]